MDLGFSLFLQFGVSRQFGLRLRDVLRIIMIARNLGFGKDPCCTVGLKNLGLRTKELKASMSQETPYPQPQALNPSQGSRVRS